MKATTERTLECLPFMRVFALSRVNEQLAAKSR